MVDDGKDRDGKDGYSAGQSHNFMARLEAAGAKARTTPAPWEQLLIEQANLREDMNELKARLRSIEECLKQLVVQRRPRAKRSGDG